MDNSYLIQVLDEQIKDLEKKLKVLKDHKNSLIGVVKPVTDRSQSVDEQFRNTEIEPVPVREELNDIDPNIAPKLNWKLIALNILKGTDELLTTNEVYDILISEKPEVEQYSRSKIIQKLSGGLTKLVKMKRAKSHSNPLGKGNFWGLIQWFDGDEIKEDYKRTLAEKYGIEEDELFSDI